MPEGRCASPRETQRQKESEMAPSMGKGHASILLLHFSLLLKFWTFTYMCLVCFSRTMFGTQTMHLAMWDPAILNTMLPAGPNTVLILKSQFYYWCSAAKQLSLFLLDIMITFVWRSNSQLCSLKHHTFLFLDVLQTGVVDEI